MFLLNCVQKPNASWKGKIISPLNVSNKLLSAQYITVINKRTELNAISTYLGAPCFTTSHKLVLYMLIKNILQ